MVRRKVTKQLLSEEKVEIRATQEWVERVDTAAERIGLKRSAYIRMVVTQALLAAESNQSKQAAKDADAK